MQVKSTGKNEPVLFKLSLSGKAWVPFPFVFRGRDLQPKL